MRYAMFVWSLVLATMVAMPALGAGTVTVSRDLQSYGKFQSRHVDVITVTWTADATDGSVPTKSINMCGYLLKVVTDPGSTAPTDNYDITLGDPTDTSFDALTGNLLNRDTANTEVVAPVLSGGTAPIFLCGSYLQTVANNSVNSATGEIVYYVVD